MTGFKPNDNAKDIKGMLLRLAPLLLRLSVPLPGVELVCIVSRVWKCQCL
jgi:hypothetical protein